MANGKAFVTNLGSVVGANLFSLTISTLLILVVPKVVGVADYGYWQLFVFALSWVGVLHFGWVDGLYLKLAGRHFESLDFPRICNQFWCCVSWMVFVASAIVVSGRLDVFGRDFSFFLFALGPGVVVVASNTFLSFVMQATNKIGQYARIVVIERVVFAVLVSAILIVGFRSFRYLIMAELVARLSSFLYSSILCREIVYRRPEIVAKDLVEIRDNIFVGSKLLISNLASLGIIGVSRFVIQQRWGVVTFGKLSLALGVSNLVMSFGAALGVVSFPVLKRASPSLRPRIFMEVRSTLTYVMLVAMVSYFPIRYLLSLWLPHYADGLAFLALLFPIGLFEVKRALLVDSFWKAMRREGIMARLNVAICAFAAVWSFGTAWLLSNVALCVVGITVSVAARSTVGEWLVGRDLRVRTATRSIVWSALVVAFIAIAWFYPTWGGAAMYTGLLSLVVALDWKHFSVSIRGLHRRLGNKT